jgi:hypothetical protein
MLRNDCAAPHYAAGLTTTICKKRTMRLMVLPVFCLLLLADGISHLAPNDPCEPDRTMALMCKLSAWSLIILNGMVYVRQTLALW